MSNYTYWSDSKYCSALRNGADTTVCIELIKQIIIENKECFEGLPYQLALDGSLDDAIQISKREIEDFGEPMAMRSESDRTTTKKLILQFVAKSVRLYNGQPNSIINCALGSIVEAMYDLGHYTFDEAEAILAQTLPTN